MLKAKLTLEVEYDPTITNAEHVASALDILLETALSAENVLDDVGNPSVGDFEVFWDWKGPRDDCGLPMTYRSRYKCPKCGEEWHEDWSCDCNGECPRCGTKDVESVSCVDIDEDGNEVE